MAEQLIRDEHGKLVARGHLILRDLPGYPWFPCPICGGNESCDHTGRERARAALPNLYLPEPRP